MYYLKSTSGKNYVFSRVQVVSGVADLGYTEIKLVNMFPAGAKIVTKGAYYILSSQNASGEED